MNNQTTNKEGGKMKDMKLSERLEKEHGTWLRTSYAAGRNPLRSAKRVRAGGAWAVCLVAHAIWNEDRPYGQIEIPGTGFVRWIPRAV